MVESNSLAAPRLRSIIERIERLEEERKLLGEDIKDIMKEAKSAGFDAKAIKVVLDRRKKDAGEVDELEMLVHTYEKALAGWDNTPLGDASKEVGGDE